MTVTPVGDTASMGFNPEKKHEATKADYVMVAAALVVVALLVAWGLFGGKL